jgi:hypothetical protein
VSRWKTRAWIICRTEFGGRRRTPMTPGRYTELFFLDEATALTAGHRPCAECRREDFVRFRDAFARARGIPGRLAAPELDRILHAARVTRDRRQIRHLAEIAGLPDDVMILGPDDRPWRVAGDRLHRWSFAGYDAEAERPRRGPVAVLTPAPTVAALAAGYRVRGGTGEEDGL